MFIGPRRGGADPDGSLHASLLDEARTSIFLQG